MVLSLNLKSSQSFTWSLTGTQANTTMGGQTLAAQIACTSPNWQGPFDVAVYWDNVYGTWLFTLDDGTGEVGMLRGHISNVVTGVPISGVPVELVQGILVQGIAPDQVIYHTFTNNVGDYAFRRPEDSPPGLPVGTLSVGGASRVVVIGPTAAAVNVAIPQPAPVLTVGLLSRPAGSAILSMAVTNLSGVTSATGVTVTGITGITATGATFVYNPNLEVVPFVIPGAASLGPNATAGFNLDFVTTSGSAGGPFSFVITVQAQNVPAFSTTINVP
jgi:hypothetical protein